MRTFRLETIVRTVKVVAALGFFASLSACATNRPASVEGGECRAFRDPGFAVRGKRLRDNQWIGRTQETGIQVCGWKRPTS